MKSNTYTIKPKRLTSRILSRLFDYLLAYLLFTFALSYSADFLDDMVYFIGFIASPLLWAPLEALLISTIGTTPGKAVLGIHIRESDGSKLTFIRALKRSLSFFSFKWDERQGTRIYKAKKTLFRYILFGTLAAAMITPLTMDDYIDASEEQSTISRLTQEPVNMNWLEFKAPYNDFQIEFPTKPKEDDTLLGKPGTDGALPVKEYSTDKKSDVTYSVSYTTLPHKWVKWGSGLVLKGALKMMAKHMGDRIIFKNKSKYHRLPAIDYVLSAGKNEKHGKLILVGHRLYKVEVSYPKEKKEATMEARHAFINSFYPIKNHK